jgi:hypothetical protein
MAIRTALRIQLQNRPGALSAALRAIAQAGVNLDTAAGVAGGEDTATVEVLPADPAGAVRALQQAGLTVREVQVAVTWLPNRAGTLARACEALGGAGINIDGLYVVATDPSRGQQAAFECADAARADQVLTGLSY